MTETPGISCGYWKARNIPALARSSAGQSVTSSPWYVTVPLRTSYSGDPMSVDARVLLPDPLGPMMAWTSPGATVRSRPLRIAAGTTPGADGSGAGAAHRPSTPKNSAGSVMDPQCTQQVGGLSLPP